MAQELGFRKVVSSLNWFVRLTGTAFGFISFGLGGLCFATCIVPFVWLRYRHPNARGRALRRAISRSFRLHILVLQGFGVLSYSFDELKRCKNVNVIEKLVVANHPTLLDVVFLVAFIENAVCVIKDSLFHSVFIGFVVRAAGYVSNKDPVELVAFCKQALEDGQTVVIFPEGTRSAPDRGYKLQRGAAYIALGTGVALTPIHITCVPNSLVKGVPWYSIPPSKMVFTFSCGDPISVTDVQSWERGLAARELNRKIAKQIFRLED